VFEESWCTTLCFEFWHERSLQKKSRKPSSLCAISVFSVSLWCVLLAIHQPQRHRGHRGCTEKRVGDFLCKAVRKLEMGDYRTIKELVIESCVAEGKFPTYEKLTSLVKQHFPNSKWQKTHYAWYKSKIKTGEIVVPGFTSETVEESAVDQIEAEVQESIEASVSLIVLPALVFCFSFLSKLQLETAAARIFASSLVSKQNPKWILWSVSSLSTVPAGARTAVNGEVSAASGVHRAQRDR